MNLLFRLVYATHCRSTHHKLVLDALQHLECKDRELWQSLFLKQHEAYLQGAKEPDTKFKDFRNHVLHVEQNYWGGACKAARLWYGRTVDSIRRENWINAVYAAGILSHYYTDPIMPFHTGQTEAENNIHRAAEWSVTKSYNELRKLAVTDGPPQVEVQDGDDWLEEMVKLGADRSHRHYDTFVERYDFSKGKKNPPTGLDDTCRKFLADLLGYAAVGFACVLDRAIDEAAVLPPKTNLTVETFLATIDMPIRWVTKKIADLRERKLVEAMYEELQRTGRVEEMLPEDDRAVRAMHEADFPSKQPPQPALKETIPSDWSTGKIPKPTAPATKSPRFYLEVTDDVVDAPSIGPKTAKRLQRIGIKTVADLLAANPEIAAGKLQVDYITPTTLCDWQDQATLACQIPQLRGHDAQILVACGLRTADAVANANPQDLSTRAIDFANTSEGKRVIRSGKNPDLEEVTEWITWAGESRSLRAA